jgi:hypothetical protein
VVFIDTGNSFLLPPPFAIVVCCAEGTFRPQRIMDISAKFGVDGNQVLENILYARAFTHEHQVTARARIVLGTHVRMNSASDETVGRSCGMCFSVLSTLKTVC